VASPRCKPSSSSQSSPTGRRPRLHPFADAADFTWQGSDEMDPVSADGWAELDDDGTINGEISFHLGDESTFKARKW
jgi:hypothetical protein